MWISIAIIIAILLYKKYHNSIIKWKYNRDKSVFNKYIKYTLWALIWNSIRNLFWQIILQMVVYFLWVESAWYYSNFLSLYGIGITVLRPIRSLLYPLTSEYNENSDNKSIEKLIFIFYNYFSIITLSFSILLIILGPEMSVALFWEKYLLSWELLSYAWIFLVFNLLASFNSQILTWLWKVKERVLITWIACIITIIVAIIWIKLDGIYWACIAFGISHITNRNLSRFFLKKEWYIFKINWKFIIKNILIFFILWITIYNLKNYIIQVPWNRRTTALRLIVFAIIFYSIIWMTNYKKIKELRKNYNMK